LNPNLVGELIIGKPEFHKKNGKTEVQVTCNPKKHSKPESGVLLLECTGAEKDYDGIDTLWYPSLTSVVKNIKNFKC